MKYDYKLGIIGYGNMAKAIINGACKSNVCKNSEILIFDISKESINQAINKGFNVTEEIINISKKCKYILLSVKPQSFENVANNIKNSLNNNVFISIMAGVKKEKIHNNLKNITVCRCMPNTPALLLSGMTALDTSELQNEDKDFIIKLFNSVGETIELNESYMNGVTAVSGSGPAYVYKFIKSFINSAQELGFDYSQAKQLVVTTVTGAAKMIKNSDMDINILIDKVCSKGGTTIEGVKALDDNNFENTINTCVKAAYKRAEELSEL